MMGVMTQVMTWVYELGDDSGDVWVEIRLGLGQVKVRFRSEVRFRSGLGQV